MSALWIILGVGSIVLAVGLGLGLILLFAAILTPPLPGQDWKP